MVNTSSGYLAYFTNKESVSGSGVSLITAFTINSSDGKSLSKYDRNLVGYWDMETLKSNTGIIDRSKNENTLILR